MQITLGSCGLMLSFFGIDAITFELLGVCGHSPPTSELSLWPMLYTALGHNILGVIT
ncbi:hypothetical protein BJ165DRAFT_1484349 [Panaeolus papilionaceus]|nr:hypothetical protein BJ165DRAFT_1484349 [Panaeolus papilionaceus]